MHQLTRATLILALALLTQLAGRAADAPDPKGPPKVTAEAVAKWGRSDTLVIADLAKATPGPVGLSEPPLRTTRLEFTVTETLRGPAKAGPLTGTHVVRQANPAVFPVGKKVVVGLTNARGGYGVDVVEEATPEVLARVRAVASLPLGWTVDGGRIVSPWAKLGRKAWPEGKPAEGPVVCATGRPALLAGSGVTLAVEMVPPARAFEFKNPDGDGEYKLTVTNATDKEVTVPALLADARGDVLWTESVVIQSQGKTYPAPGAAGVPADAKPVVLKPGASVSGVVNALRLEGPEWPRGGYRIEFRFGLGEKRVTKSFYYFSNHHDPIRAALGVK